MYQPRKISEKIVAENPFLKVLQSNYEDENGNQSSFLITSHNKKRSEATFILPITKDNKILFLKEFRYGPEKYVINFPVGMLDDEVDEIENCKRELKEETGYSSEKIEYVGESIIENYFRGSIKYFIAYDCIRINKQNLEIGEEIQVFEASIDEFEKMVLSNQVASSKTCYLFLLAKAKFLI